MMNRRAQAAWAELLGRVAWDYFVTLTVDPRRWPRMGEEAWRKAWSWFMYAWIAECAVRAGQAVYDRGRVRGPWANAWGKGRGRPMTVLALEPHRDGRLHAHALVKLTRDLKWLDYSVGHEIWNRERGRAWIERPHDAEHVVRYVTKYVTKHQYGSGSIDLSENFDAARLDSPAGIHHAEFKPERACGSRYAVSGTAPVVSVM